jgi:hypothetical protein
VKNSQAAQALLFPDLDADSTEQALAYVAEENVRLNRLVDTLKQVLREVSLERDVALKDKGKAIGQLKKERRQAAEKAEQQAAEQAAAHARRESEIHDIVAGQVRLLLQDALAGRDAQWDALLKPLWEACNVRYAAPRVVGPVDS